MASFDQPTWLSDDKKGWKIMHSAQMTKPTQLDPSPIQLNQPSQPTQHTTPTQ